MTIDANARTKISADANQSSAEHVHVRRAISNHFAGRVTPAAESAMRAHLSSCAACKHMYDRHLILARLDPRAISVDQRLARGLGFRLRGAADWDRWSRWAMGLAIPAAAAALLLAFSPAFLSKTRDSANAGFTSRGAPLSAAGMPSFWTYRIGVTRAPQLASQTITRDDELAFAYSNPAGKPYLMIFGVDEHRHIYWFHPAWPTGQVAPTAIRAAVGPGPHELSDAIRHSIDGRSLDVYALFSERPITTTTVEQRIRAATGPDWFVTWGGGGTVVDRRTFQVLQ